ncbi:MAG: hypothetical protein V2I56_24955 [Desulfobacteraceae bacterium]|jgi:hypothetical protein|nr:hypothetical protein [Desulfobacteraceae bacterium]
MRKQYLKLLKGLMSIAFVGTMFSCATDSASLPKQTSLPESERSYYSDEFDTMREDLWDPVGYLYRDEQMQNFKQTDMNFEKGKLILRTRSGSFSKGGLASKFAFRGNFDIQLECRMDFAKNISRTDMDQLFSFAVLDKSLKAGKMNIAIIGLAMGGGADQGYIFGNYVLNGKRQMEVSHRLEHFNGSLRILRTGKDLSLSYKNSQEPRWVQIRAFRLTGNDMIFGFQFRNFFNYRTTIEARDSISIQIDRFTINSAQEIIEEEI